MTTTEENLNSFKVTLRMDKQPCFFPHCRDNAYYAIEIDGIDNGAPFAPGVFCAEHAQSLFERIVRETERGLARGARP